MAGTWCPNCRAFMVDGTTCPECRRRLAWGKINLAIKELADGCHPKNTMVLGAIEAVAFLMQDRQALIHQHRRDMRDEQRAASRSSGEAFDQGRDEGRRAERDNW